MSTGLVSLLPFLRALQRQQSTPQDEDDSNPPSDQLGRVGSVAGLTPAPSQSNPMGDIVQSMAQGPPPMLMQLLQAGVYPSPPKPGGPGTPQSSDPKQAQATDDDDDSKPPVDPSGLVGVVPGASQSNTQNDAIGNIVRSMKPGALPVYPPLQAAAQTSASDQAEAAYVLPPNVQADKQAALERGQATQPPVSDAQRQAGLVIRVGKRPLHGNWPVNRFYHTYLEIPRLDKDGHPVL